MAFNAKLLDGLVIFVEVINAGSFTRAAENTGHSTSYISKEINKLESRLGVRLMNRTTRSISLTPEGKVYHQQCQQIIDDAEQAQAQINQRQAEPKGTLKVSCPVSFGLSHVRPVLAKFLAANPKVNLELDLSDRKVDIIAEGFDVVIRGSMQLEDSSLISRHLLSSYGVTVASPDYLATYGTPQHPGELADHQIITYSYLKTPDIWEYQTEQGQDIAVKVKGRVLTNSPEMELELALSGQGITRMPMFNLGNKLETGELVSLFDDYRKLPINIHLVYPSRKHMAAKVRHFIDFVIAELGDP
ncbi:LysR family transcriptional regulator [Thalassomonas viridans]|uniref:LysR family transcriptional regulator n=1 Tax=Thalassomonas viridans TaxID=137584 RepID=A0AAF0C9V9_9GAMM|nr:LysR family transcriptional regulator [Thalassomonas viridans]WDE05866.1 LysR family transcriptional regulator [Thalassomonas viridans]